MRNIDRPDNPPIRAILDRLARVHEAVWEDFGKPEYAEKKKLLRETLLSVQGGLCAYCERRLPEADTPGFSENCHIEHFRPRKQYPNLTFDWNNLFLSCSRSLNCGQWKDSNSEARAIDIERVFKPDEHAVRLSECFIYQSGEILPAKGLSPHLQNAACLTIQKFNLNSMPLVNTRRKIEKNFWECFTDKDTGLLLADIDESLIRDSLSGDGFPSLVDYLIRTTSR